MQSPTQSLGRSVEEKVRTETTLCTVLSQVGTEQGSRRLTPLVRNEAKPDNTDNKKSRKYVTLVRNFSFDIISSSHKQTYTCGQDKQNSRFWLQKDQMEDSPFSLLCTTILLCTLH